MTDLLRAMRLLHRQRFLLTCAIIFVTAHSSYAKPTPSYDGLKSLRTGKIYSSLTCKACEVGVGMVKELLKLHVSEDFIAARLLGVCKTFNIEKDEVCDGVVKEFKVSTVEHCVIY